MANISQRSFASGEIAPALYSRCDTEKYASALRTCRNLIVQRTGGLKQRPGLDFVAAVKDPTKTVSLRKFIFSPDLTNVYVLEFGDHYVRFFQDGAPIAIAGVPYEVATTYTEAEVPTVGIVQTGDVLYLVHPNHPPATLTRTSSTSWALADVDFDPPIWAPLNILVGGGAAQPGALYLYEVTAIDANGIESPPLEPPPHPPFTLAFGTLAPNTEPTAAAPATLTWDAVAGAIGYNVYRSPFDLSQGQLGFIGFSSTNAFSDPAIASDPATLPPQLRNPFDSAGNYPSVVGFYQQRLVFANTTNAPETVWTSRTGDYANFRLSTPLQDDDPITFTLANAEVCQVRHILDLGKMVLGTDGGEWLIEGDTNGVLTPFSVNPRVGSYNGCAAFPPLKVGNSVLYVQALGNKVLELKTNILYGYYTFTGKDLTVYATHLFEGYTIVDWDYAQIPNYVAWAVRSDGMLLGLTYIDDEQLLAWHHHDTGNLETGFFENACVVPEGGEHRLYVVVRRIVNGSTVRSIERLRPMALLDIAEASYLDAALEYDGRDAGVASGTTLTMTAADYSVDAPITLLASASEFGTAQVGDARFLRGSDGTQVVATISGVTSDVQVTVHGDIDVPVSLQNVGTTDWDRAVQFLGGLDHLVGESVAVFADGDVVGSPNNPDLTRMTVDASGDITLPQAYAHIRVGLPYLADAETLDIDTPQGSSLKESALNITKLGLWLDASRGVWMGTAAPTGTDATDGLVELKIRSSTQTPGDPNPLATQFIKQDIPGGWNDNGRVFVRQIDPVPLNLMAVIPFGYL